MATARPVPVEPHTPKPGKRGFAKRAQSFAKRAAERLPGFPYLWIGCGAAAGIMVVTGGFGTIAVPVGQRTLFWLVLMGWTGIKWQLWFLAMVRAPRDWLRASVVGMPLLCAPLPIEIGIAAASAGIRARVDAPGTWLHALGISAILLFASILLMQARGRRIIFRGAPVVPATDDGILQRARVAPDMIAAIEAEDHYCRVRRRDGSDALIHYRFGDALSDVAAIDGARVHRGAWVASEAITGATREGRRWLLLLTDGSRIAVSTTHLAEARARGWLNR